MSARHSLAHGARPAAIALVVALVAAAAAALMLATPARGDEPSPARVTQVTGRQVVIEVPVTGRLTLDELAAPAVAVTVQGATVPATVQAPAVDRSATAAALVLDTSGSMAGARMAAARTAASAYLAGLPDGVDVALVTFADEPVVAAPLGASAGIVDAALARVRPEGDTSLFDGVRLAVSLLPQDGTGRLVVLTDGADTASAATLAEAARAARSRGVAVDVVLLGADAEARASMRELAVSGRVTSASDAGSLVTRFEEAATALRPTFLVRADIPSGIDAAGRQAQILLTLADRAVRAGVRLPEVASLGVPVAQPSSPAQAVPPAPVVVQPEPARSPSASAAPGAWIAALAAAAAASLLVAAAWTMLALHRRRVRRRRIAQVLSYGPASDGSRAVAAGRAPWPSGLARMDDRIARSPSGRRLAARLIAAEIPITPSSWLVVQAGCALGAVLLLSALTGRIWLGVLLGVVSTLLVFGLVLRYRVTRRQQAFSDELPEFLLLLSSALRAGLSFTQSLESAAGQHRGQVGRQIRRALAEAQVSSNLDEALLACAARMANEDLQWTVTALGVQREVGGNLSVILDNAAATIKGRHTLAREVRTLSAEGRLSAYVLISLPLGVFGFLLLFRREYVSALWTHPLGIAMMIALVILMILGWIWMRAIVRIRV